MLVLAFFHIEVTAAILGVCLVTELLALLVFGFAVLIQGGDSGIPFEPLSPAAPWDNDNTAILGASATGIALFGAFWSWVGFEMAPNYAEESRDPKRIMAVATYASVIGLGVLYTFISWMFVAGWGMENVSRRRRRPVRGRLRLGVLPAHRSLLRRAADLGLRAADRHRLVRVSAGVLQHVEPVLLLDGPRGHPAERPRADAPEAPQPVPGGDPDDDPGRARSCSASCSTTTRTCGAGQAGHVDPADGHVRHPDRAGARLGCDHLLLR